ncbi:MAG: N-acetylmuramoyl-L-alanine amidase [Lachnospiraceae bacterium]|nr:N-acetylmuramoyl-L-alanine amidase [Lachnospiraceae bacterium]
MKKFLCHMFLMGIFILGTFGMTGTNVNADTLNHKPVVVIDPGHGGENEGTIENGFLEKDMTLKTSKALYDELSASGLVTVYMTRTEDVDLSLKERADFARQVNADMLLSIHYNASVNHDLYGSEVWVPLKEPYNSKGYKLGLYELNEFDKMGLTLRGIKCRESEKKVNTDYYGILRQCSANLIPSVIIEHCHVDNINDSVMCDEDEELTAFAKADANAVLEYFGLVTPDLEIRDLKVTNNSVFKTEDFPTPCYIELKDVDSDDLKAEILVSAHYSERPFVYYSYSLDGGRTFSERFTWPGYDYFDQKCDTEFEFAVDLNAEKDSNILLRGYDQFDVFSDSNVVFVAKPEIWEEEINKAPPEYNDKVIKTGISLANKLRDIAKYMFVAIFTVTILGFVTFRLKEFLRRK